MVKARPLRKNNFFPQSIIIHILLQGSRKIGIFSQLPGPYPPPPLNCRTTKIKTFFAAFLKNVTILVYYVVGWQSRSFFSGFVLIFGQKCFFQSKIFGKSKALVAEPLEKITFLDLEVFSDLLSLTRFFKILSVDNLPIYLFDLDRF